MSKPFRSWSVPVVSTHDVGPWALPEATAWRRAVPTGLGVVAPPPRGRGRAQRAPPPMAIPAMDPRILELACPTVADWLRDLGRSASLHLVVHLGGGDAPEAWLGVSRRASTEAAARAALQEDVSDLGELLDTWHWFDAGGPDAPPVLGSEFIHLSGPPGSADDLPMSMHGGAPAALPAVLRALASRPARLGLHVAMTPWAGDPSLVREARDTLLRAQEVEGGGLPWEFPLLRDAALLHERVNASLFEVSLQGRPMPGRAVRTWLAAAFSSDIGCDLAFRPDPVPLLLQGSRLDHLLELLAAQTVLGTPDPSDLDAAGVPF